MIRQVVLDTETTGLEPEQGHRIVELACVEIVNRRLTGNVFQRYLNPGRGMDLAAVEVHGLTAEFLEDKPRFADIAGEFLDFVRDAELIIHNAPFDVAFLDAELAGAGRPPFAQCCRSITDTLRMAKEFHPGKRNSLDALCERYDVDYAARKQHGALIDAGLLGEVFLAMTRGQDGLFDDSSGGSREQAAATFARRPANLIVLRASDEELAAHTALLQKIDAASKGRCLWLALGG